MLRGGNDHYLPSAAEVEKALFYDKDEKYLELIYQKRYGLNPVTCPKCKRRTTFVCAYSGKNSYRCNHRFCGYEMNPLKGTIFFRSHVPLRSWFIALNMLYMWPSKTSGMTLSKELGVSLPIAQKMKRVLLAEIERQHKL